MSGENLKKKYALTDKGVLNTKKGAVWTVIVNLIMMAGMGILYLMMQNYMDTLTDGAALPNAWLFVGLLLAFVVLSFVTHLEQYRTTYGLVYNEVRDTFLLYLYILFPSRFFLLSRLSLRLFSLPFRGILLP